MGKNYKHLRSGQALVDYWLEEGGNIPDLRSFMWGKLNRNLSLMGDKTVSKHDAVNLYLPQVSILFKALIELDELESSFEDGVGEIDLDFLMRDYAIYAGQRVLEDKEGVEPKVFLESFMEMHAQPPKKVCRDFMWQFYTEIAVHAWMDSIVWDEDEEEGL